MSAEINNLRPINEWIELIKNTGSTFYSRLNEIYGDDDKLKTEAAGMCLRAVEAFANAYGPDRSVIIVRSTGRLNLLGTHIDHRGGSVNPIAIRQMWLVAEPRNDDIILVNQSGRGDKDIFTIADAFDDPKWKQFITHKARQYHA